MEEQKTNNYAGFWIRLASSAVDGLFIYFGVIIIFTLYFWFFYPQLSSNTFLSITLILIIPIVYVCIFSFYFFFTKNGKQSPGKKLFKLRIVDNLDNPISTKSSFKRSLLFIFDTLLGGIGFYFTFFNSKKQALHDRWSGTFVKKTKNASVNPRDILIVFFCFFAFTYTARIYINLYIQAYRMPLTSMEPSILLDDLFFVDKHWPRNNTPQPGDLIVFKYPKAPSIIYAKRCIAVEGQTVRVSNDTCYVDGLPEGNVVIKKMGEGRFNSKELRIVEMTNSNGKKYDLQYYKELDQDRIFFELVEIPEGCCFVLGDNRDNSADSRHWGLVPYDLIIGKIGVVYLSTDRTFPIYDIKNWIRWDRFGKQLL